MNALNEWKVFTPFLRLSFALAVLQFLLMLVFAFGYGNLSSATLDVLVDVWMWIPARVVELKDAFQSGHTAGHVLLVFLLLFLGFLVNAMIVASPLLFWRMLRERAGKVGPIQSAKPEIENPKWV